MAAFIDLNAVQLKNLRGNIYTLFWPNPDAQRLAWEKAVRLQLKSLFDIQPNRTSLAVLQAIDAKKKKVVIERATGIADTSALPLAQEAADAVGPALRCNDDPATLLDERGAPLPASEFPHGIGKGTGTNGVKLRRKSSP